MNFTTFFSMLFALLATLTVVTAAAAPSQRRDVWAPKVTFPTSGVELIAGNIYTITWDTSNAPSQITNPAGAVFLREGGSTAPLILAGNFPLTRGSVDVTIPLVPSGKDYSIVLSGDSGNFTPAFSISRPSSY